MPTSPPTLAVYVIQRLADLGLDKVFGVPGDYSFPIDDAVETVPGVDWVVSANELNAAYAADGYARLKGAAILTVTYGVGELSALNGVMGAKAHRLPVFVVVGEPSTRIQRSGLVTHHTLGDGVYGNFFALSSAAAGASAQLTPQNAVQEVERVISEALRLSMPGYFLIPEDLAGLPIIGEPVKGRPLSELTAVRSDPQELKAALAALGQVLAPATRVVALPTFLVERYGAVPELEAFLAQTGVSFATLPMDKGILDESHPAYLGMYNGRASTPGVQAWVEEADVVLDLGGVILEDLNSASWSSDLSRTRHVVIGPDFVKVGAKVFVQTALRDVLAGLASVCPVFEGAPTRPRPALLPTSGAPTDAILNQSFYPRLQAMLRPRDLLVCETGGCNVHLPGMLLPEGVGYAADTLWGAIGWGTPAVLGLALGDASRRVVLVTGDGAHQISANELGVMGRYGIKPVIFVLNNGVYGIEIVLSETGHGYDDLAPWRYAELPYAMGCDRWLSKVVRTVDELDQAIAQLQTWDGAAYIVVVIPASESVPQPHAVEDNTYKLDTPS